MFKNEDNERVVVIDISPDCVVTAIYDDEIKDVLADLGEMSIKRASHVEPSGNGQWIADMSPVGGGVLGPFDFHAEAIVAEQLYLMVNIFSYRMSDAA